MTKLHEAFEEEAKGIDVEDLMAQMLGQFNDEKGYTPTVADEIKIRKMILARKYIEREVDRLTHLKQAIMDDWTAKINNKVKEIESINDFIESFIKNYNKGEKLSLDVATATLRRSAPKVKVADVDKAVAFLTHHKQLQLFLKPAQLDTTLLQNTYINDFNKMVEKEAEARIAKETEANAKGKISKKREGEIRLEVERELADEYYRKLPEFFEYTPETHKLSITMK